MAGYLGGSYRRGVGRRTTGHARVRKTEYVFGANDCRTGMLKARFERMLGQDADCLSGPNMGLVLAQL